MGDPFTMWAAGLTDVGKMRRHNEDTFCISEIGGDVRHGPAAEAGVVSVRVAGAQGFALGVYDGTGGFASGRLAADTAARTVAEALAQISPVEPSRRLIAAVEGANRAILAAALADPNHRGMGATATVATQLGEHLFVAQLGDTRAYLLRGKRLVQITRDDTLMSDLLRSGKLLPEDVATFQHPSVVLQALGVGGNLSVAVVHVELRLDDVLLLCSDGLHALVKPAAMRAVLLRQRAPGVAARVLLDEANAAGGNDNLAIVIARFEGAPLRPAAPEDVLEDRSPPG